MCTVLGRYFFPNAATSIASTLVVVIANRLFAQWLSGSCAFRHTQVQLLRQRAGRTTTFAGAFAGATTTFAVGDVWWDDGEFLRWTVAPLFSILRSWLTLYILVTIELNTHCV